MLYEVITGADRIRRAGRAVGLCHLRAAAPVLEEEPVDGAHRFPARLLDGPNGLRRRLPDRPLLVGRHDGPRFESLAQRGVVHDDEPEPQAAPHAVVVDDRGDLLAGRRPEPASYNFV